MNYKRKQDSVIKDGYAKEIYEFAHENPFFSDPILLSQALVTAKRLPDYYGPVYDDYDHYDDDDDYPLWEDEDLAYYYYVFARDIEGADVDLLCKAVCNSKDVSYIYLFARDVKGANISLLEDAFVEAYCNVTYYNSSVLYDFATDVKGANIKKLEKAIPDADLETMYDFAVNVEGADTKLIERSFLKTMREIADDFSLFDKSDYNAIYRFAKDIKGADVNVIINSFITAYSDMEFLYKVARDVEGVNLDLIEDRMIKLFFNGYGSYYLDMYIDEMDYSRIDRLEKSLKNYYSIYSLNKLRDNIISEYNSLLEKIDNLLNNNQMKLSLVKE